MKFVFVVFGPLRHTLTTLVDEENDDNDDDDDIQHTDFALCSIIF